MGSETLPEKKYIFLEITLCFLGYKGEQPCSFFSLSESTINAKLYIHVFKQHMLPCKQHILQGRPCTFQQNDAKLHSACITRAGLSSGTVRVLNWSPIKNFWSIMKKRAPQGRPWTVEQLKFCIGHTWANKSATGHIHPKHFQSDVQKTR